VGRGVNCTTEKKYCTTAKKIVQLQKKLYNCKINGTTAKLHVGIIQEISTTAKKMALQKNCTTAKTNAQLGACHNSFLVFVGSSRFFPR
jgi:hypothetical protein